MFTPSSATAHKVTRDDAERANDLLKIGPQTEVTPETVRAAFRARIREAHPYAGGDEHAWPERLKHLQAARDTLLAWLAQAPKLDCKECRGRGFVAGKWGAKPCSRCG